MSKEHRTKRVIEKYFRTNKTHKRSSRDKTHQARSLRRDHSVKTNILQKSRENTNLFLNSQNKEKENKIQRKNVRIV